LFAEVVCVFTSLLSEEFSEFSIFVILPLLSLEMHTHLGALGLCGQVRTLSLFFLRRDNRALLVQPHDFMVHALDGQKFFFEQFFLLNEESLRFADRARDLLTSSLRLLLVRDLELILLLDLLL